MSFQNTIILVETIDQQRITFDLHDGEKFNYPEFGGALVPSRDWRKRRRNKP